MTLAWYVHLHLKQFPAFSHRGLVATIFLSWGIALLEYCAQVPANQIGFAENGGPFNLWQLKVIQEVITLVVFAGFTLLAFKDETLRMNHIIGFGLLAAAVYFLFKK